MKIKYIGPIPESLVEKTLQDYIDEGWHWWPQTFNTYVGEVEKDTEFGGYTMEKVVFWSFILTRDGKEELEIKRMIAEANYGQILKENKK